MRVPLDTQRSFYLTLISMIQSLAFGYLLTAISWQDLLNPTYAIQVMSTFLVVLLVWHEYAIGTMLYVWLVDFWDSVIPFLFGITQYFLISALKPQAWPPSVWFFSLSGFAALSFWAFWNQFAKGSHYMENRDVLLALGGARRATMIYIAGSFGLFFLGGMLARSAQRNGWLLVVLAATSAVVLVGFAARGIFLYPKVMRRINCN